jgi:hypothetical protein
MHLSNGSDIQTSSLVATGGITNPGNDVGDISCSGNSMAVGARRLNGDGGGGVDAHALDGDLVVDRALGLSSHGTSRHCSNGGGVAIAVCGLGSGILNMGDVNDVGSVYNGHDIVGCDGSVLGVVDGHKIYIFIVNISLFHVRYRRYVPIINEFHEFCCSTISSINYRIFFCEQLQNNYYKALEKATYTIYETTYKTICITIFA